MEYDADSYEIKLAGSEVFEATTKKLGVLAAATKQSYKEIRAAWNLNRRLPENFPAYLSRSLAKIPAEQRTLIEDSIGLSQTGLFDTHPSPGDRIRQARRAADPGVFHLDYPAAMLFSNFEEVSKEVTFMHYENDIGLPVDESMLVAVEQPSETT
jgi:hypothetical protein